MGIYLYSLLLTLLIFVPSVVQAATSYAMIVGVSKYQSLDEDYQLNGPKYDAEMVRDFLAVQHMRNFPRQNITVLADGVSHALAYFY